MAAPTRAYRLLAGELRAVVARNGVDAAFPRFQRPCDGVLYGCGFLVGQFHDEVEERFALGDGEQVTVRAFDEVGFHVAEAGLQSHLFRPAVYGRPVLDDGSGLFRQAPFTPFPMVPPKERRIIDPGPGLCVDPQVNAFGTQHRQAFEGAAGGNLFGTPVPLQQKRHPADHVPVAGFGLGRPICPFFRKRLCVRRLVAVRRFGRPDAVAAQFPTDRTPVYAQDACNGGLADTCSKQRFNLVPLPSAEMSEF